MTMANIAFVGLGMMGLPMAANLAKAGHRVLGFDLAEGARQAAGEQGLALTGTAAEAAREAEAVITMLPAGKHLLEAYRGPDGLLQAARPGRCSWTARQWISRARGRRTRRRGTRE